MKAASDFYQLAGAVVRVDWQDDGLREALDPALACRRTGAAAPALVIHVRVGEPAWPAGPRDRLLMHEDAGGVTVAEPVRGLFHRLDAAGATGEFVCRSPTVLPGHELAAPFRLILQRWLQRRGSQLFHAAAVGLPGHGAVLLAARSGGGKSNTTLACLDSPLRLLGEDYVAVEDAAAPRVWSLYNLAKLHPADLARFPRLASAGATPDGADGKVLLQLGQEADRWADGLPLRAILVLKIGRGAESRIVPAAAPDAVKAMLTSLLMVLPGARRPLFAATARLAARLPVYRLELGTDPGHTAGVIHRFIHERQP